MKVSFQGERGAYSESAAAAFFGSITSNPCSTFRDAMEATVSRNSDRTILPVENSIAGSVGESYDLLYETPLFVMGEAYHRIEHCLIGTGSLEDVRTVYSHPQALGQCSRFLEKNRIRTIPTYDTAGSVAMVADLASRDAACIASAIASEIHGMPVIRRDIADNPSNYTRFLVLGRERAAKGGNKTSIILSVSHKPGALYDIIKSLSGRGINLLKIESRPRKETMWEYNFYMDIEGTPEDAGVQDALDEIKSRSLFLKNLGSYTMAERA